MRCGLNGVTCFSCQSFETCAGAFCQGGATGGGGGVTGGGTGTGGGFTGTGGGSGTGGGFTGTGGGSGMDGGTGTGVEDPVDHLQLLETTLTFDAGTCVGFQLEGRDAQENQVAHVGAGLNYSLEPASNGVSVFGNASCTVAGATFVQGPAVQTGRLRVPKFGETWVYPTVLNPPFGYSQGQPVQVLSRARVSGLPTSLVYNACTPVTLTTTAPALKDTELYLQSSGNFEFSGGGGCFGAVIQVSVYANSSSASAVVRTSTGGTAQLSGAPDVLDSNVVNVTVTRPDGGACFGDGVPCGSNSNCCSDTCMGTCWGTM